MQNRTKVLWTLIMLYAVLFFLPAGSSAQPGELLKFEPGDTLEQIREKIKHNGYSFTVDHNWVFDMSAEEKEKFFSRRMPAFPRAAGVSEETGPLQRHLGRQLPASFDWRNHNGHSYIGPIRDQGGCGSCYAFGACAAAEGTYNWANGLYDGNCADFSEAFVAFCLSDHYSGFDGCLGSDYDYDELTGLVDYGVCNESAYPYTDHEQACQASSWSASRTSFESWHRITCNDIDAIKTAIMTYGVVDASVLVVSAFKGYSSGVYEDSNTSCNASPCYYTETNHVIALVGWDDNPPEGGGGVWILRNSWGGSWGENGYMRIRYTSAHVACEGTYLYLESPAGLKVTPSGGLSSEGSSGGPFSPAGINYTLENQNDTGINYTVSKSASWVSISDTGGSLAGHATTDVTVSINSNANSLSNGTYADTIYFTNTTDHDGDTTRGITLTVAGVPTLRYSWNMDSNPGWTTGGLWAWGQPTGGGGAHGEPDPTSGYTGSNVYGYNLSGDYENDLPERHLTTGAIDCTGMSQVTLKFRRWLGVESASYDHAYVRVSNDGSTWTTVWENSSSVTDSSWSLQEFDISSVADGQSTVYLRWSMGTTDDSWQYCGWNIDDVEIWAVATSPAGQYTLSVTKAGTGTGTVISNPAGISCGADCSEAYDSGTDVTLTASPDAGSRFSGWSGSCSGSSQQTTVTMDADKSCTAAFAKIKNRALVEFLLLDDEAPKATNKENGHPVTP